jgi:hypothetical protein
MAKKPKGASYSEVSPPKLRTTDLSTQLSSNIEDSHIFASRTASRYATPPSSRLPDTSLLPSTLENPAPPTEETTPDGTDRRTAEVLAKARLQAMKGTAVRSRRTLGADVTHNALPTHFSYPNRHIHERTRRRKIDIFRPRLSPGEDEWMEPKTSYHCGASADDAFHFAASIFRAPEDPLSEHPPLPMLCFAKPVREDTEEDKLRTNPDRAISQDSLDSSMTNASMYHEASMDNATRTTRPIPLYDHYLVLVSEDHKDEIARIMKSGTHKSFEWMHLDDSSEYMNASSEDKQDPGVLSIHPVSIQRLSHDDMLLFDGTSHFLPPVTEESEAAFSHKEDVSSSLDSPRTPLSEEPIHDTTQSTSRKNRIQSFMGK